MTNLGSHTRRGDALLLAHCAAFGDTPSAYTRLEQQVGEHLARLLVFGLSAPGARGLVVAVDADEQERQKADDAADDERDAA
jgi:hypothetical protein